MNNLYAEKLKLGYSEQPIITSLTTAIPDGRITALIGPNGCGKSTLLRALAGLLKPWAGDVILDGKPIRRWNRRELALKVAFLPQKPQAPEGIRVSDLVGYGRFPYQRILRGPSQEDRDIVYWAMEQTGVAELAHAPIDALSGGQQQRVWIAMAIAQQANILLLDEPTTFLDWGHQLEVLELLTRLNAERALTVVMSLHDLNQAAQFAHHVLTMKAGDIITEGKPADVLDSGLLQNVFGVEAECLIGASGRPCFMAQCSSHKVRLNAISGKDHAGITEASL